MINYLIIIIWQLCEKLFITFYITSNYTFQKHTLLTTVFCNILKWISCYKTTQALLPSLTTHFNSMVNNNYKPISLMSKNRLCMCAITLRSKLLLQIFKNKQNSLLHFKNNHLSFNISQQATHLILNSILIRVWNIWKEVKQLPTDYIKMWNLFLRQEVFKQSNARIKFMQNLLKVYLYSNSNRYQKVFVVYCCY